MNRLKSWLEVLPSLVLDSLTDWRSKQGLKKRIRSVQLDAVAPVVVYTAIFGGRDILRDVKTFPGVSYVCFTDDPSLRSRTWEVRVIKPTGLNTVREAKHFKVFPHLYFPDHEYSIWVDGSYLPSIDPRYCIHRFLEHDNIALFKHPHRSCIYDEMEACIRYNKDDPRVILAQEKHYRLQKHPENIGLATCSIILRKHHLPQLKSAMQAWWAEIEKFSSRDQLSFNFVTHQHSLRYGIIPGNVYNNHFFSYTEHARPNQSQLQVGWILNGTQETASARLMGYNMHRYLNAQQISSTILFAPRQRIVSSLPLTIGEIEELLKYSINVLVIVKLQGGPYVRYLLDSCRKKNIKIVYVLCDDPSKILLHYADVIVAPSSYYQSSLPRKLLPKLRVAFDGFDHDKNLQKQHTQDRKVTLCLVTNQVSDSVPCIPYLPEAVTLKIIGPGPKILASSFKDSAVFSKSAFAFEYVNWSLETVIQNILRCDVGILPWENIGKEQLQKSSNRLVMLMALGLPVIASPLPSYKEIIRHGENGFIANGPDEWISYCTLLRDNPALRAIIGTQARKDVLETYSSEQQGELFLSIINEVFEGSAFKQLAPTTVLMPAIREQRAAQ